MYRSRARQWSRTALAMGLLLGSLPVASRFFLGGWGFDGAAAIGLFCFVVAAYLTFIGRRPFLTLRDPAAMMERALRLSSIGRTTKAIQLLSKTIHYSPKLWQAFQYRGELYLQDGAAGAALRDFDEAIRLAPDEPNLYMLRTHAQTLLGSTRQLR